MKKPIDSPSSAVNKRQRFTYIHSTMPDVGSAPMCIRSGSGNGQQHSLLGATLRLTDYPRPLLHQNTSATSLNVYTLYWCSVGHDIPLSESTMQTTYQRRRLDAVAAPPSRLAPTSYKTAKLTKTIKTFYVKLPPTLLSATSWAQEKGYKRWRISSSHRELSPRRDAGTNGSAGNWRR